jgi:hypothetical protein
MSNAISSDDIVGVTDLVMQTDQFQPIIRRARYQRLTIYEVEESELQILETGSPDSILLNIAIALFTFAATLTVTLFTATFASNAVETALISATIVGYVAGGILVSIWFRTRSAVSKCVKAIRDRLPPDWVADSADDVQGTDGSRESAKSAPLHPV